MERLPDSDSSNVYVCGAVRKPQIIKLDREITLGSAISTCGGLEKDFTISVFRKQGEAYSVITIGLGVELYKPSGYAQIALRKNDLIVVTPESF